MNAFREYLGLDLTVRSDGSGRVVEGLAAVFSRDGQRITDGEGTYMEVLDPSAFDRTIGMRGTNFGVFYNHAKTIYGTPDGALSVPIGVPLEVQAAPEGVRTVTQYLDNPLADAVLDGIRQGAIRGQSFSGRFIKSTRAAAPKRGALPTITRHEVDMREYGPTVFPAYPDAVITGTRSLRHFLDAVAEADPEDLDRLRELFGTGTPLDPPGRSGTPADAGPATSTADTDPPDAGHSTRQSIDQRRAHIARLATPRTRSTK